MAMSTERGKYERRRAGRVGSGRVVSGRVDNSSKQAIKQTSKKAHKQTGKQVKQAKQAKQATPTPTPSQLRVLQNMYVCILYVRTLISDFTFISRPDAKYYTIWLASMKCIVFALCS